MTQDPPAEAYEALTEATFDVVRDLAHRIWHQHYATIVSPQQIDYMLAGRFTPERLRPYVGGDDRWMFLVREDGTPVGYFSYALAGPLAVKLEQLYVVAEKRGRGTGSRTISQVERAAARLGAERVRLTVNKRNEASIRFYERRGYAIEQAAVFDIGGGYVMDDFVMAKRLRS